MDELAPGIPGIDNHPQEPLPNYLSPGTPPLSGRPGGAPRVALTGEVIDTPSPPSPLGLAPRLPPVPPRAAPPNTGPLPPPPARAYTIPARRETVPAKSNAKVILAVVAILLLVGGGAFGFWFWQQYKKKSPAGVVERFFAAFKNKDGKEMMALLELPPEAKGFGEALMSPILEMAANMVTIKDYKIGDVKVNGDTATVSVTTTVEFNPQAGGGAALAGQQVPSGPQTSTSSIPLKRVTGEWKLDASQQGGNFLSGLGGPSGGARGGPGGMRGGGRN